MWNTLEMPCCSFCHRTYKIPPSNLGYFSWPWWRICPLLPETNIVAVWLTVVPLSLTLLNQTPPTPGWRQLTVPDSLLIWDWAPAYGWLEWSSLRQSTKTEICIYNVCNIINTNISSSCSSSFNAFLDANFTPWILSKTHQKRQADQRIKPKLSFRERLVSIKVRASTMNKFEGYKKALI